MEQINQLLPANLDAVYAFYGCAFLFLGLAVSLQPKIPNAFSLAENLHLIGFFGYLHGIAEFLVIVDHHTPHVTLFAWLSVLISWASYMILFEFARRAVASRVQLPEKIFSFDTIPAIYLVTTLTVFLGMILSGDKLHALSAMSRYIFGFPAAIVTGFLLYQSLMQSKLVEDNRTLAWATTLLSSAFVVYGFIAGLITEQVDDFPTWLPTQEQFLLDIGVSIAIFRAICAFIVGVSIAYISHILIEKISIQEREARNELDGLAANLEARVKERTFALTLEIDKHKKTAEELQIAEQHQQQLMLSAVRDQQYIRALLSAMNIGILFEDNSNKIIYVNPAFGSIWEMPSTVNLVGQTVDEILKHTPKIFVDKASAAHQLFKLGDDARVEFAFTSRQTFVQTSHPVLSVGGELWGRLWIFEDITEEMRTAQKLIYLAERDVLTGLFNRHRFQEHLEYLMRGARRNKTQFGVLCFGLDEFKYIYNTLGSDASDLVLTRVASKISSLVRAEDFFARIGGDEFAILAHSATHASMNVLGERITQALASLDLRVNDNDVKLTASVGVAIFPQHGNTAEELVAHADIAMHHAKTLGKNHCAIYDAEMEAASQGKETLQWHGILSNALTHDLFTLHFQGVYSARSLGFSHLEALIRLQDGEQPGKLIMPGEFIHYAEKSLQIREIDRWVIRNTIQLLKQYPQIPGIAVNVSGRSFGDQNFPLYIQDQLQSNGVEPSRLIFELTETAAVSDLRDAQYFAEVLKLTGCRIYLDDFGSGFSTFTYLKHLYIDAIKIDGQFIRDLDKGTENIAFVSAMIGIARSLKKQVAVKFVENEEILELVRDLGVDMVQGYHLSRPSELASFYKGPENGGKGTKPSIAR
ncbi:MAG: EAL domain-containing protein [Gammaproteobacteria bacterium]|nr:EAL domain-containing protein [Gammaproteobacteria bacterium]